jgi:uncharacterized protein
MTAIAQLSEATQAWLTSRGYPTEDLNASGQNGDTALMKAVQERAIAVVESLLNAGVDVNRRNQDGNNALWFACHRNHLPLMRRLIDAQINFNNQNDNGSTALMYAASSGKDEALQVLLSAGADPELKNLDDFRAIDFASTVDILRLLRHAPH